MKLQEKLMEIIEDNCKLMNNGASSDNGGAYAFIYADGENEIVVDFDNNDKPFNISISCLERKIP